MDSIIVKPVGQIREEHLQQLMLQSQRDQDLIDRIKMEVSQPVEPVLEPPESAS